MAEERKTCFTLLSDAVGLTFAPLEAFFDLFHEREDDEIDQFLRVANVLLEKQKAELEKIFEAINQTVGKISLENPMYGEYVKFEGRTFEYPELIRAVLEPLKPTPTPCRELPDDVRPDCRPFGG